MGALPYINQLSERETDGLPDPNAQNDCVAAVYAAILDAEVGGAHDGGDIKDAVYGEGYDGPTDPARYIPYMEAHGVTVTEVRGTQAELVNATVESVNQGGHAVLQIPSQWGTAPADPVHPSGSTHAVGASYMDNAGNLHCMNPWGGFNHVGDIAYWQARICYGVVYITRKAGSQVGIPQGWHDDGSTLSAPNGKTVVLGFRDYILGHAWDASNQPIAAQFHTDNLLVEDGRWGAGDVQPFTFSVLMYADNPQQNVGPKGYVGPMPVGIEWNMLRTRPASAPVSAAHSYGAEIGALQGALDSLVNAIKANGEG